MALLQMRAYLFFGGESYEVHVRPDTSPSLSAVRPRLCHSVKSFVKHIILVKELC